MMRTLWTDLQVGDTLVWTAPGWDCVMVIVDHGVEHFTLLDVERGISHVQNLKPYRVRPEFTVFRGGKMLP